MVGTTGGLGDRTVLPESLRMSLPAVERQVKGAMGSQVELPKQMINRIVDGLWWILEDIHVLYVATFFLPSKHINGDINVDFPYVYCFTVSQDFGFTLW